MKLIESIKPSYITSHSRNSTGIRFKQVRSNPRSEKLKEAVLADIKDAVRYLQQRREALQKALDSDEAQLNNMDPRYFGRSTNIFLLSVNMFDDI